MSKLVKVFTRPLKYEELPPHVRKFKRGTGCWVWRGLKKSGGYGYANQKGRSRQAHRVIYELMVGPIPDGLHIDHLCRNRRCVRPSHLEPVTKYENMARGFNPAALNMRKTQCKWGHEFNSENTGIYYFRERRKRYCKTCKRAAYKSKTITI